jgi:hypothetical protein
MAKKAKVLRRAQSISPFGPGAIIDIDGESFVATDISRVNENEYERIEEPRLARSLGKNHFRTPKESSDREVGVVPFERFPNWLFCPKCRRLTRHYNRETPYCDSCKGMQKLTPMRFVMACPRGHLSDIPWDRWAHSKFSSTQKCENPDLRFITLPGGSGLDRVIVKCETCKAQRNLQGIADRDSLRLLGIGCPGRQPWQFPTAEHNCDAVPQGIQRGATNLTFLFVESALSLPTDEPTDDLTAHIRSHPQFSTAVANASNANLQSIYIQLIATELQLTDEQVKEAVTGRQDGDRSDSGALPAEPLDRRAQLLAEEYTVLASASTINHKNLSKTTIERPQLDIAIDFTHITRRLTRVARLTRLREVRAVVGFSRLAPVSDADDESDPPMDYSTYSKEIPKIRPVLVPADLRAYDVQFAKKWLPAIEVFGEGIFLQLDEGEIQRWEKQPNLSDHLAQLVNRASVGPKYLPPANPRFILLHTFAHLLLRQLSFECGYSIASLRERIYFPPPDSDDTMAGILIYTSAGDSEGTLGGLVRQADPERLLPVIASALEEAQWCSSDPLCRDSKGQGPDALNLAACHSCTLLPETSCIYSNRLLDRTVLIGSPNGEVRGFFSTDF